MPRLTLHSMRSFRAVSIFPLAGALTLFFADTEASACSYVAPVPTLTGYPADADVGVPTDVVPFYDIHAARLGGAADRSQFTLTAENGDAVPLIVDETHVATLSLTPAQLLQPNTNYVLAYVGPEAIEPVSFTTGNGPLTETPSPPAAFLEHFTWTNSSSSCDPPGRATCVALPVGVPVELTNIDSFGEEGERYLYTGPAFAYFASGWSSTSTDVQCVKLRTRAENGSYSAARVLCADDAAEVTLDGSTIECTSNGMSSDGDVVRAHTSEPVDDESSDAAPNAPSGAGCTFALGMNGSGGFYGAGLLFASLTAFARRRRTLRRMFGQP